MLACRASPSPPQRGGARLLLLLLAVSAPMAFAQTRPTVVELFTSQGCSSCPPADAYLGRLSERGDVVALAFHVDYWNSPEWRDRFSLPLSTARQDRYVRNLGKSAEYTPQFIVDGRTELLGARAQLSEQALAEAKPGVALSLEEENADLRVEIGAAPGRSAASEVILVSYLGHASSAVTGGENSGRKLEDFNVVRSLRVLGSWRGEAAQFHVPMDSLPADATAVAVLLQVAGQGPILGAAAHSLRRGAQ